MNWEHIDLERIHNLVTKDPNNIDLLREWLTRRNHWRKSVRKARIWFERQHFASSNQSTIWRKIFHSQPANMRLTPVIEGQTEFQDKYNIL